MAVRKAVSLKGTISLDPSFESKNGDKFRFVAAEAKGIFTKYQYLAQELKPGDTVTLTVK